MVSSNILRTVACDSRKCWATWEGTTPARSAARTALRCSSCSTDEALLDSEGLFWRLGLGIRCLSDRLACFAASSSSARLQAALHFFEELAELLGQFGIRQAGQRRPLNRSDNRFAWGRWYGYRVIEQIEGARRKYLGRHAVYMGIRPPFSKQIWYVGDFPEARDGACSLRLSFE